MQDNPAGSGRRIAVLAVLTALLLGYGYLAVVTALDRAAASSAPLASFVPDQFQQRTLASEALRLREADQAAAALPLAVRLVARDPMSFDSVGHLATARFARNDVAGALAAFRVSAALGWRDAYTQAFWLQAALGAGDFGNAALRFGALARQWPRAPVIDQLSALFEADARGRAALASQIATGASWATTYATPVMGQSAEQMLGRANVLVTAAGMGANLGCDRIVAMTTGLAQSFPDAAAQLWRSHCPRAAVAGAVSNGRFVDLNAISVPSPFDWKFPGDGALELEFVNSGDDTQALQVRSGNAARVPVAQQMVPLRAGSYRLSWTSDAPDAATAARMLVSLSCQLERQRAEPVPAGWVDGRHSIELAFDGACQAPYLQLWLAPGSAVVQWDNIALVPA